MELLAWRVRIAVLWIVIAVSMSAHMLLEVLLPGTLGDLLEGRIEDAEIAAWMVVMFALFWLVPLVMAFVTLVLRDRPNRYANAGVGVIVTAMWVWGLIGHLVANKEMSAGVSLTTAVTVAAGLAILWHVWKWPEVNR
ncbi:MAG: DUF6326 family protein [Actinomycetota bacterium]